MRVSSAPAGMQPRFRRGSLFLGLRISRMVDATAARLASVALPASNLPRPVSRVEKILARSTKIQLQGIAGAPLRGTRGLIAGPAPR